MVICDGCGDKGGPYFMHFTLTKVEFLCSSCQEKRRGTFVPYKHGRGDDAEGEEAEAKGPSA